MTTTHVEYHEKLEEWRAILAKERARADRLCAEDGSPEARAEAKSIRLRVTHAEKKNRELDDFVHGRGRWAPDGDLYRPAEVAS